MKISSATIARTATMIHKVRFMIPISPRKRGSFTARYLSSLLRSREPGMTSPLEEKWGHLLGERVFVTLDRGDERKLPAIATGTLLRFSTMGEIVIEGDDGDIHFCWPGLTITPAAEEAT